MTSPNTTPLPDDGGGHPWLRENYATYLAGGLDASENTLIEKHLAACAECAAFAGDMLGMEESLKAMFADARIDGIEDRIINNLRENAVKKNTKFVWAKRIGLGIAAALVLGATGVMADYAVRHDLLASFQEAPQKAQSGINRYMSNVEKKPVQIAVVDASESMKKSREDKNGKTDELDREKKETLQIARADVIVDEKQKEESRKNSPSFGFDLNGTNQTIAGLAQNEKLAPGTELQRYRMQFEEGRSVANNFDGQLDLTNNDLIRDYGQSGADNSKLTSSRTVTSALRGTESLSVDGSMASGITKVGTGKFILSNENTYSGDISGIITNGAASTPVALGAGSARTGTLSTNVSAGTGNIGTNTAVLTGSGTLKLSGTNTGGATFDSGSAASYTLGDNSRPEDVYGRTFKAGNASALGTGGVIAAKTDLSNTAGFVSHEVASGYIDSNLIAGGKSNGRGTGPTLGGSGVITSGNGQDGDAYDRWATASDPTAGELKSKLAFKVSGQTSAASVGAGVSSNSGLVGQLSLEQKDFDQAQKTAQAGDYFKAQEMFKQALEKDPNNAAAQAGQKLAQDSLEYQEFQKKNQGASDLVLGRRFVELKAGLSPEIRYDIKGEESKTEKEKEKNEVLLRSVTETVKQIPDDHAMIGLIDRPIRLSNTVAATQAGVPATQPTGGGVERPERKLTAEQIQARKIIRNGTVEYEVRNFDDTQATVMRLVEEEGGFVASTNSDRLANGKMKGVIVVRVPPDRLDTLVLKLRGVGELKAQQIGSSDVSKQYTDMESKLRALKVMEARLIEIIKTGNGDVKQLVEAETRLNENRQQMEQIVGELKYYDNLVAMATLTVSAYEKDIRQAAAVIETERSDIGIETEDVEAKYQAARKIIDDAKGRVVSSALKRLEGDQVNATIVCRVAQDAAGPVVDQLRQLGRVSRYTRDKVLQSDPNVTGAAVKTEMRDAEIQVSLYNLANVPPRETTYITVAVPDVQEMFGKILEAVRQDSSAQATEDRVTVKQAMPAGKVINSSLTGQKPEQMSATILANVRAADFKRVMDLIKSGGGVTEEVLSASVVTSSDIAGTTLEKKGIQLTLQSTANVAPRETLGLNVAVPDVQAVYDKLLETIKEASPVEGADKSVTLPTGRVVSSSISGQRADQTSAGLTAYIRASEFKRVVEIIKSASGGKDETLAQSTSVSSDTTGTSTAKKGISLSLVSSASVLPRETFMLNVAATSVKALRDEIKKLDAAGKVRIVGDTFNEPNARDVNAGMRLQVAAEETRTIDALFSSPGVAELTRTAQRSEDVTRTSRKVAYEISIVSAEALPPIRDSYVKVEVPSVKASMDKLRLTGSKVNSREIDSRSQREDDGSEKGQLVLDVPVIAASDVAEAARSEGDIKESTVRKLSNLTETALSRDRVSVVFVSKPQIIAANKGFNTTVRDSVSSAAVALQLSLYVLLTGLLVLAPWLIVAWAVRKYWKRKKMTVAVKA